ncbi:MAG: FIST N-terminal domain-containing protein, partial [Dokdonella sp.]
MEGQRLLRVERASVEDLGAAIGRLCNQGFHSFMLLACEDDRWDPAVLSAWLRTIDVPVFGGIFPSIIHRATCHRHGTLIIGFVARVDVAVVNRLSDRAGLEPQLLASAALLEAADSLVVLFDGLCPNLEAFVEGLHAIVGVRAVVVGGGAGHLDLVQRPCLLGNAGVLEDSALLVALPGAIDHGVAHGWQRLAGPFLVTRSHGNVLEELNYQSAFDVYRKEIEAHGGQRFSETDFFSISKTFPLGIEGVDGDFLVRDPIKQSGDALVCVGELPQNATVYLLKGEAGALI